MLMSQFYAAIEPLIDWAESLRPSWSPTIDPSIVGVAKAAVSWDWLFPVHEFMLCAALWVALFSSMLGYKWAIKICDWIADVIP